MGYWDDQGLLVSEDLIQPERLVWEFTSTNNADFWESNGPVFVPSALTVVEVEFRETLALCYLLLRLSWPNYRPGQGQLTLLNGPQGAGAIFAGVLTKWLLPEAT